MSKVGTDPFKAAFDDKRVPAPSNGQWLLSPDNADEKLLKQDFSAITTAHPGFIPVIITAGNISTPNGTSQDAAGVGYAGVGIIINTANEFLQTSLLAHELGHYAGYSAGDVDKGAHNSDSKNVMNKSSNGDTPDADWCAKVVALIKEIKDKK